VQCTEAGTEGLTTVCIRDQQAFVFVTACVSQSLVMAFISSFIHFVVYLTTSPQPLPQSGTYCLFFQFPLYSLFLNVIQ